MEDKSQIIEKYKEDVKSFAKHVKEDAAKLGSKAKDGMLSLIHI